MGSLHDAYELGGIAGFGRTTRVRLGVRRGDCFPVALKQLRSQHVDDDDRRRRFVRQARRAQLLSHDAIEKVMDVLDDDGRPVIVAEWIDGRSLHRLAEAMRRDQVPWPINVVAYISQRLLQALRHAHHHPTDLDAEGMVHGSVNPRNVLIDIDGAVKLVDFGLAAVLQEAREPWQSLEAMRYLSADHVRYGASPASDLYGVGAIVHELLHGERFRDECETESDMREAIDHLEPPARPRDDIPAPLERLRRRLLERVPNPRVTLEHMLDLCAAVPVGSAQGDLRALVRNTLRNDSTQPDSEAGTDDDVTTARRRSGSMLHQAASTFEQVPMGGRSRRSRRSRRPRGRDTQPVPVPHDHEQTAPRRPLYLQQTAPPASDQARDAEARRSGGRDAPTSVADVDTAPIPVEPGAPEAELPLPPPQSARDPRPFDPGITAEVDRAPRIPDDRMPDRARPISAPPPSRLRLNTPLGWALVGALVAGVGLPLLARCSADDRGATTANTRDRPTGASRSR